MELDQQEDEKNLRKEFAEILKNKDNEKLSWEGIIKKLEENGVKIGGGKDSQWLLKKLLYEYSINVPEFYNKLRHGLVSHEFKGFSIAKDLNKSDVEKVRNLGLDSVNKDIEKQMSGQFEDNIID